MTADVLETRSHLFLGSRLRRLGERMQADVLNVIEAAGLPIQPSQYPVLATLDAEGPQTVGALVEALKLSQPAVTRAVAKLAEAGLVCVERLGRDQRLKTVSLTEAGRSALARSKAAVWPRVEAAVRETLGDLSGPLLDQLSALEARVAERPLHHRARDHAEAGLRVLPYRDDLAPAFRDINAQWITAMYALEEADRRVLDDPRGQVIDPGGDILFVEAQGLGVVGTCALLPMGEGVFELCKMGVREEARGLKAGEFLLRATLERAQAMGAKTLFLLSNRKSQAAIHLYEKLGFVHDAKIMARYAAEFARCDVAMLYAPGRAAAQPTPPRQSGAPEREVCVVAVESAHAQAWAAMRDALWPDAPEGEHLAEVRALLAAGDPEFAAFVALAPDGTPAGFAEAAIRRDYVNGCDTSPVGFAEGLYVDPAWRRRGTARTLAAAVEAWARGRGCTELASDADLANTASHAFHAAAGFEETERVVFFRKAL